VRSGWALAYYARVRDGKASKLVHSQYLRALKPFPSNIHCILHHVDDLSARLCSPPAIDREFRTIDFLSLLDLQSIPDRLRARFFQ
jgi:putative hemolysin